MSLAASVGTIAFVDLRLIGAAMRRQPLPTSLSSCSRGRLGGFAMMFLSGGLLFLSEPLKCYHSAFFEAKLHTPGFARLETRCCST